MLRLAALLVALAVVALPFMGAAAPGDVTWRTLASTFEQYDPGTPWPQFGHDPQHTGRSASRLPGAVSERWRHQTGVNGVPYGPVIAPDRTVYAAGGGYVFALDPNGIPKWRVQVGASSGGLAVGTDGTVYAAGGHVGIAVIQAIAPDGALRWETSALADSDSLPEPSLALGPDGTVYVGVKSGPEETTFHAFNATTGVALWAAPPAAALSVASAPAVSTTGSVYVSIYQDQGYIQQITAATGVMSQRSEALGFIGSSPAIAPDGTIYVGSSNGIHAINPQLRLRWTVRTHTPVTFSSPAVGADGTVYIGAGDRLYAVSPIGQLKWSVTACLPGGTINSAPAIGADGSVVFQQTLSGGAIAAALCAVDESGLSRWRFVTQGQFDNSPRISSPAIGGDGLVYVGSPDGHIYAVHGPVFGSLTGRVMIPLGLRNAPVGS